MEKNKLSFIEIFKASYKVSAGITKVYDTDIIDTVFVGNKEIFVVHKDDFVHYTSSVITSALNLSNGREVIAVDKYYFNIPDFCKKFVISHEIGHIALGHLNIINTSSKSFKHMILRNIMLSELETNADLYAVKICGMDNAIKALNYIKTYFKVNEKEIDKRIKSIKESAL